MKPVASITVVVFCLIALTHLHRLVFGWDVIINGRIMPMWTSVTGTLIAATLAVALWWESRSRKL